ncbi:MAG: NADH-quinone oxidoreductase subunit I [Candidatus Abyssubacteria bacterium]
MEEEPIKKVEAEQYAKMAYEMNFIDRLYLPALLKGLAETFRHLLEKKFTIEYPEQKRQVAPRYRGLHRLNKDELGRIKCVACFMCSTICPARCIYIQGAEAPWPDREKYPVRFDIDELRCIYCGMCEEACPVEAIELTEIYDMVGYSRRSLIYNKEMLLEIYDKTKDKGGMKKWL